MSFLTTVFVLQIAAYNVLKASTAKTLQHPHFSLVPTAATASFQINKEQRRGQSVSTACKINMLQQGPLLAQIALQIRKRLQAPSSLMTAHATSDTKNPTQDVALTQLGRVPRAHTRKRRTPQRLPSTVFLVRWARARTSRMYSVMRHAGTAVQELTRIWLVLHLASSVPWEQWLQAKAWCCANSARRASLPTSLDLISVTAVKQDHTIL